MDDIEQKVRRNLIVVSLIVIAVAFLQIPMAGKILNVDLGTLPPWRLWLAVEIMLAYLFLRFHFSAGVQTQLFEWSERAGTTTDTAIYQLLKQAGLDFIQGAPTKVHILVPKYPVEGAYVYAFDSQKYSKSSPWTGTVSAHIAVNGVHAGNPVRKLLAVLDAYYTIPMRLRIRMQASLWRRSYRLSWNLLELWTPYLLFAVATFVATTNLVKALHCGL